jgi:hypothetical protein
MPAVSMIRLRMTSARFGMQGFLGKLKESRPRPIRLDTRPAPRSVPSPRDADMTLDTRSLPNADNDAAKRMFKWLVQQFSGDGDDPGSLGSERGLEAFIARLPSTSPATAVEAISEQLEQAASLELAPEKLRRALKRLDEHAQEPVATLSAGLFEDDRARTLSDTVWLTLARYYRNAHCGYRICLETLPERSAQSGAERSDAVLIAARAMAALGHYKALLKMRYRDVEPKYWTHVVELATWSTRFGSSSTLIELYPRTGQTSSFEREYLVALLFEAAPFANLLPSQMVALDVILRRYAANYQFSDHYRDATPFVLDLQGEPVARRWLKDLPAREGLRFFGVAAAYSQLAQLRKQARASREIPDWLRAAQLDTESYRLLLDLLVSHWSVEPPLRLQRRTRAEGEVLVAHGIDHVRRMIAASEYAKAGGRLSYEDNTPYDYKIFRRLRFGSVEEPKPQEAPAKAVSPLETLQRFELEGDRQMTERWTVADVSESGLGAMVHAHGGWARVGMLIGFRHLDSLDWHVAIVRRLSRSSRGRLSVGLKMIPGTPCCARLRVKTSDAASAWLGSATSGESHLDCVMLRHDDGTASLLLEPGRFKGELHCMISFEKRWHSVRLESCMQHGYDYEQVAIRILSEEPRAHLRVASTR